MFKSVYCYFADKFEYLRTRRAFIRGQNRFYRPKARARYRSRLVWFIRQLFPLTYWSIYHGPVDGYYFAIWKMWFGRCYRVTDFQIPDQTPKEKCDVWCKPTPHMAHNAGQKKP